MEKPRRELKESKMEGVELGKQRFEVPFKSWRVTEMSKGVLCVSGDAQKSSVVQGGVAV